MSNRPVVALDASVLLRLAGLDVLEGNTRLLGLYSEILADVFGAVADPDRARLASPLDDPV